MSRTKIALALAGYSLLVVLAFYADFIAPARAADLGGTVPPKASDINFEPRGTNCYVGAFAGMVVATDKATITSPYAPDSSLTFDGLGSQGGQGGVKAGCDLALGPMFFVGVQGDYVSQDVEHKTTLTLGSFTGSVTQSLENSYSVVGRFGVHVTKSTDAYGLVGYTWAESSPLDVASSYGPTHLSVGIFKGVTLGGGMSTKLDDRWAVDLEYRYTQFDARNVDLGFGNLKLEPDVHNVRVGLTYKLFSR